MNGQGSKTIRKVRRKKVEPTKAIADAAPTAKIPTPGSLDAFAVIAQSSLDAIPMGFCVCRTDTSLVRYNRRAVELWGRELPLGEPTAHYSDNLRRYRADGEPLRFDSTPVAQALRSGERVVGAELVIEQPDGARVPVLMNVQPLKDDAGRVEGAVCSFQELTERKRAEEALRASEAELQSVINRTPFMMVRCSRDIKIAFILALALMPGALGEWFYRTLVGVRWGESQWTFALRLFGFSIVGLAAYCLLCLVGETKPKPRHGT